ncbi:DUF2680 domain-containing protein [Alkaliphilus hydrothermalis]|uniref:Membrane protein YgcG n=1 Tax=Alkaliphilus hydrothermalis TaxID=1482730 RepID=A0ABS2NQ28_9FIRM|nr:DUF2680 domain-containing protein [Alkaliphilus hydrothermalis]MBM7614709.1 putative membrane protein YgcG [Alkaliphilus hydrothermalis]
MERRWKIAIVAMGIVGLMASASFAATGEAVPQLRRGLFFDRGASPMEVITEKAGITVEQLLQLRELGLTNQEIMEKYDLNLEEIREEVLQEKYKVIDEKVAEGLITAEEAEVLKERMETRLLKCDENSKGRMGLGGRGKGRGFGGRGQGFGGRGCGNN